MRDGKPFSSRPHRRTRLIQIPAYGVPQEVLRGPAGGVGEVFEGLVECGGEVEVGVVRLRLRLGGRLVHGVRVGVAITGGRRNIAGVLLYGSALLAVALYPGGHRGPRMYAATRRGNRRAGASSRTTRRHRDSVRTRVVTHAPTNATPAIGRNTAANAPG